MCAKTWSTIYAKNSTTMFSYEFVLIHRSFSTNSCGNIFVDIFAQIVDQMFAHIVFAINVRSVFHTSYFREVFSHSFSHTNFSWFFSHSFSRTKFSWLFRNCRARNFGWVGVGVLVMWQTSYQEGYVPRGIKDHTAANRVSWPCHMHHTSCYMPVTQGPRFSRMLCFEWRVLMKWKYVRASARKQLRVNLYCLATVLFATNFR